MTLVIYVYFGIVAVYVQWSTGLYGLVLSVALYESGRDELLSRGTAAPSRIVVLLLSGMIGLRVVKAALCPGCCATATCFACA